MKRVVFIAIVLLCYNAGRAQRRVDLPELTVTDSPRRNVLHMVAHVREYSTLTSCTDTVRLFREKIVDFMRPRYAKQKFRGWTLPRVLTSVSYYRFTNCWGLDSVSDSYHQHFSWSDWIGLPPGGTRYPADVDVLDDETAHVWVPQLESYFSRGVEFSRFNLQYDEDAYSFSIASGSGGRAMSPSGRRNEPCQITTDAEVKMLDQRLITTSEARKWERRKYSLENLELYESDAVRAATGELAALAARVQHRDVDSLRSAHALNPFLTKNAKLPTRKSFGQRLLDMFHL